MRRYYPAEDDHCRYRHHRYRPSLRDDRHSRCGRSSRLNEHEYPVEYYESDETADYDSTSHLEDYVRRRFLNMADNLQAERKRIAALLKRYESANASYSGPSRYEPHESTRRYAEYANDDEASEEYEIPERRRKSDRVQWDEYDEDLTSLEEKASEPEPKVRAQDVVASHPSRHSKRLTGSSSKARPRYQAPTASSRIRVLEQEEENRLNAEKDTPAHEEVYPAPLHWAARLGIPSL